MLLKYFCQVWLLYENKKTWVLDPSAFGIFTVPREISPRADFSKERSLPFMETYQILKRCPRDCNASRSFGAHHIPSGSESRTELLLPVFFISFVIRLSRGLCHELAVLSVGVWCVSNNSRCFQDAQRLRVYHYHHPKWRQSEGELARCSVLLGKPE